MSIFITLSDFNLGVTRFNYNCKQELHLQKIIDEREFFYLNMVFGCEMAKDMLANPSTYVDLNTITCLASSNCCIKTQYLEGTLKEMLQLFISYEIQRDSIVMHTPVGTKVSESENSQSIYPFYYNFYNRAILIGRYLQAFSKKNPYALFKCKEIVTYNYLY